MAPKRLTLLRDGVRSFRLSREPSWPQDRVVEIGLRISVKVISGFGERDQGRKVVLRGQEIVA